MVRRRVLYNRARYLGWSASAALIAWCASETASSAPDAAPSTKTDTAPAQAVPSASAFAGERGSASPVLATFSGGRITVADMQAAIAVKSPAGRAEFATGAGRERLLRELIRFDLLVQEAEGRGYADHPAVLEAGNRAAIEAMQQRDLAVDPAAVPAEEVTRYFEAHLGEYQQPAQRRAAHIQLETEAEAKTLIAGLRGASRERFAQLAVQRSRDERTRRQGGELGYFDRAGKQTPVAAELVRAAFALKRVGQISPRPIRHAAGFSVLMLSGKMPAIARKLLGVEAEIRAQLARQLSAQVQDALLAELRERHKPVIHPGLVSAVVLDPVKPSGVPHGFPAAPPDPRAAFKPVEPDGY